MITVDLINKVLELMAKGKSTVQVAAALRISVKKFNNLVNSPKEHEEMRAALREAIELGQTLHEAHFEEFFVDAMGGKVDGAKEGLIKAYMQNKFKWLDKSEVKTTATDIENLTDEELAERRKYLLEKLNAK